MGSMPRPGMVHSEPTGHGLQARSCGGDWGNRYQGSVPVPGLAPVPRNVRSSRGRRTKHCARGHLRTHGPQPFWYQGPISWKPILPETGSSEIVWG